MSLPFIFDLPTERGSKTIRLQRMDRRGVVYLLIIRNKRIARDIFFVLFFFSKTIYEIDVY